MKADGERRFLSFQMTAEGLVRLLGSHGYLDQGVTWPSELGPLPEDARLAWVQVNEGPAGNRVTFTMESDALPECLRYKGWISPYMVPPLPWPGVAEGAKEGGLQAAGVRADRLELKAGRLRIDLDALTSTGTILLDEARFPVREMTIRIVAGLPVEVEAKFWTEGVADAARQPA